MLLFCDVLSLISQALRVVLWCWSGNAEGRIEDVENIGPAMFAARGSVCEDVVHLPPGENALETQQQQYLAEAEAEGAEHQNHRGSGFVDDLGEGMESALAEYPTAGEISSDGDHQSDKVPCLVLSEPSKGNNERGRRNWTEEETRILLRCKVEGGRFLKRNETATCWNSISQEIKKKAGIMPSEDQCRLRYDTLLKAYKACRNYCMKTGKTFTEVTGEERLELKLATTLTEEWYRTIDEIRSRPKSQETKSRKRSKLSSGVRNEPIGSNPRDSRSGSPPPLIPNRSSDLKSSFQEEVSWGSCHSYVICCIFSVET